MDPVTHSLLGALSAQAVSKARDTRFVAGIGVVAALLPDLDTLVRRAEDPLLMLSLHRHFTHSLIFTPVGALIAALICWPWARRHLSFQQIYWPALVAYLSHNLLDFCTSYGIHWFWPFVNAPVAGHLIAVVDPVFSLVLLLAFLLALAKRRPRWSYIGLALGIGYLSLGWMQQQRALSEAEQLAADRGITPDRMIIKPTMANLVLWRAVTVVDDRVYTDGIRVGMNTRFYPGETASLLRPEDWEDLPDQSRVRTYLDRLYDLSDHLLTLHPDGPTMVGDVRFALLPTSTAPLWGLRLSFEKPNGPVAWENRRRMTPSMRTQFVEMVQGRDITL